MDVRETQNSKQLFPKLITEGGILIDVRVEYAKHFSPKLVTEGGMLTDVREVQLIKHLSPKLVTEEGITVLPHPQIIVLLSVSITALQFSRESYTEFSASTIIDVREEHIPKQASPKLVTEEGILMDGREEQPSKQFFPILVTEDGILTDVREEQ